MGLPPVEPPSIDVNAAAAGAIAAFDSDSDGAVSKDEATASCLGIASSWDRYDSDNDGSVSAAEFAERFSKWSSGDTGLMNLRVELKYRNKELPGATIKLTPYQFLGPQVLPAEGETSDYGFSFLSIPKDLLPESQRSTHGMQVGLYRVEITHPHVKLPAKYNTESELSVDLSPNEANTGIRFALK